MSVVGRDDGEIKRAPVVRGDLRLPGLLLRPPWTVDRPAARPPMMPGLRCPDAVCLSWEPGERAGWWEFAAAVGVPRRRPDWESVAARQRDGVLEPLWQAAFFLHGPADLARPLVGAWLPDWSGDTGRWARAALARFGLDAVPFALAVAHDGPGCAEVLLPLTGPPVATLVARWLGRADGEERRRVARAWLRRHPMAAARALVPHALGRISVERHMAGRALRALVAAGHRPTVEEAAASYGAPADEAVRRLLDADLFAALPVRVPGLPDWAEPDRHPAIRLRDTDTAGHTGTAFLHGTDGVPPVRGDTERRGADRVPPARGDAARRRADGVPSPRGDAGRRGAGDMPPAFGDAARRAVDGVSSVRDGAGRRGGGDMPPAFGEAAGRGGGDGPGSPDDGVVRGVDSVRQGGSVVGLSVGGAASRAGAIALRGGGVLSARATRHLTVMLAMSRPGAPYPGVAQAAAACDPASLAAFGWSLFRDWLACHSPPEGAWTLLALGLIGDDTTVRRLAPYVRRWPGRASPARAVTALEAIAAIGSDVALRHLHLLAGRAENPGIRARAGALLAETAAARGLTGERLADRLVPDAGLDADGGMSLDYGPRRFRVGLDAKLRPFVVDAAGERASEPPPPAFGDDPQRVAAARDRFARLRHELRTLGADEIRRMQRAMVDGRRWGGAEFREFVVRHPLLRHVAHGLVWGVFDGAGAATGTFRLVAGEPVDVHGRPFPVSDTARVGVAHPVHLDGVARRWAEVLKVQPFAQLRREVGRLRPDEERRTVLVRYAGRTMPASHLSALRWHGWRPGEALDDGLRHWIERDLPGGLSAVATVAPPLAAGLADGGDRTLTGVAVLGRHDDRSAPGGGLPWGEVDPVLVAEILRDLDRAVP
ncbi:hypothetical protein Val02_07950 [Virgisporangium aliadipatigenens]|uniref:DUF4132 domain-containing protein n=1 Tax=Virgisporangium aliadipatigenens TaxID=741659 RepID=A0A8J3YEY8_9ACTN|nr:DUF4132 domain-containing protein [Virgisporangium aliadipatigenens]GIJ43909.1 hypothetical protein Val02_07950 [Virgisporangium aliadipatigenens]